jgi:hypothetical protein
MGLFKERIKTITEIAAMQQEVRNAARNAQPIIEVFTHFSYTRNINFGDERRKA